MVSYVKNDLVFLLNAIESYETPKNQPAKFRLQF